MSSKFIRRLGVSATSQKLQTTDPKNSIVPIQPKCSQLKKEIDYDYFFNAITKRRRPSMLRAITHTMAKMPPDTILFGVGIPNVNTFPFQSFNVMLKDGSSYSVEGKHLKAALQYLPSVGYLPLVKQFKNLVDKIHGQQDWEKQSLMITAGAQEAQCMAIEMILNEGDPIIVPSQMYAGTVDLFRPFAPRCISLPQDKDGVIPDILHEKLEQTVRDGLPLPKIMYTNPTGCNPTGVNLSNSRKRELYQLACDYNFLILEDDPYYLLHFMDENLESFLSLDTEGRVIRFDSLSKVMSSGLRIGFVTGPAALVKKIELHIQVSTLHTSALSQVIVSRLIDEWGLDRLLRNFEEVKEFYREKRDFMIAACQKHLTGLAEWNVPKGGMFLWLRIDGVKDTYKLAMEECVKRHLLIVPGHSFHMHVKDNCNYIRLSYSLCSVEQMDEGCAVLADVIRKHSD